MTLYHGEILFEHYVNNESPACAEWTVNELGWLTVACVRPLPCAVTLSAASFSAASIHHA